MKKNIILIISFVVLSAIIIYFSPRLYKAFNSKFRFNIKAGNEFVEGEDIGEHGKIKVKLKVDNAGVIKEVFVTEYPDNEIAISALQKLINYSLDKSNSKEIDAISGATETSNVYKNIISKLIDKDIDFDVEIDQNKISLKDEKVINTIERLEINNNGFKSGIGSYIFNQFQDADYNKNGNLVTNEYICAVMLNDHDRIEDVKFDHIVSNISFTRQGKVPTGEAKAYVFASDKSKSGFNGIINDGNFVDIFDFEKQVLTIRHYEDIKGKFQNKAGYAPLLKALENAISSSRFIGADEGDSLGLACYKVLRKKDIVDSTDDVDGKVNFSSNFCMLTVNKNKEISSCMFDNVENNVTLTSNGKILGSREKEIYSINEMSNSQKYSKISNNNYLYKIQLNFLADYIRGNTIDNILNLISKYTDDKGLALNDSIFSGLKNIDFIEFIDLISRAFVDAIKIK